MTWTIAVIVVVLIVVLAVAATRPPTFRVQRATIIQAPAATIFPFINDFHRWASWSPFEKLDPAMKKTYSGAANGTGAVYEWVGNSKAGAGRMEITDTSSPSKAVIKLDFIKPFEGHNVAEFTLETQGAATNVTWAVHGPRPFLLRVMGIFVSMDKMIGKDFATGLANLKAVAEQSSG